MDKVTVFFNSNLHHFSQLLTGLDYLKKQNKITLKYELEPGKYHRNIFRTDINGRSVFFDMADSSVIDFSIYDEGDFYIKRMLTKQDSEAYRKMLPYGLNYQVYHNSSYLKFLFLHDRRLFNYSMRYSKSMSRFLNIKDSVNNNSLKNMESLPSKSKQILFRSRLWDPGNTKIESKKKERIQLNKERTEINRSLKHKFPENFKGGIQKDSFSIAFCPDLLLPSKEYHKRSYIKILKECGIGIVNQGLEDSISWKMGEYVAHGMGVITSPIDHFALLGDFKEDENYLKYETVEECVEKTEYLFHNDKPRNEMQIKNQKYYAEYLHPAEKLKKIFNNLRERN